MLYFLEPYQEDDAISLHCNSDLIDIIDIGIDDVDGDDIHSVIALQGSDLDDLNVELSPLKNFDADVYLNEKVVISIDAINPFTSSSSILTLIGLFLECCSSMSIVCCTKLGPLDKNYSPKSFIVGEKTTS